ncbi:MAG: sigma factor-like helix-turn-helix DNA-binding protein [Selenomonadaceae bacterium]|nr:sigma factor-like helix-turn-helix DNA-binding protein [Selenomonadaceae bacterium]
MALSTDLLLHPADIDRMRRPQLAEMLAIAEGSAYLLSSEGGEGDERMTVLIVSAGTWGLITDAPANLERGEEYRLTVLTTEARKNLRLLLGIPEKVRKESTGRPKKYTVEQDGMEIFLAHVYEGLSIKRIALERDMSPTTVQKLLNEARLIAADNLVQGVWSASPDSANYQKNLDVLAWAAQHSVGEKRAAYAQLRAKLQRAIASPPAES